MFRLEGVIIRLFVEPYRRYIKYSAHFGIPKSLHLQIQVKLLQYCCLNVFYIYILFDTQYMYTCMYNAVKIITVLLS